MPGIKAFWELKGGIASTCYNMQVRYTYTLYEEM